MRFDQDKDDLGIHSEKAGSEEAKTLTVKIRGGAVIVPGKIFIKKALYSAKVFFCCKGFAKSVILRNAIIALSQHYYYTRFCGVCQ